MASTGANKVVAMFLHRYHIWWRQFWSPGEKEACAIHQGAAQRTGKGVLHQQIHHQGQKETDIRADKSDRETSYYLVSEPARKGEENRQQIQDLQLATEMVDMDAPSTFKLL